MLNLTNFCCFILKQNLRATLTASRILNCLVLFSDLSPRGNTGQFSSRRVLLGERRERMSCAVNGGKTEGNEKAERKAARRLSNVAKTIRWLVGRPIATFFVRDAPARCIAAGKET